GKGKNGGRAKAQGKARPVQGRAGAGATQRRLGARRRADLWRDSRPREETERGRGRRGRPHDRRGGDARAYRGGGVALDRRAGRQDARRRARETSPDGGESETPRGRPGRGGDRRLERDPPRPRRPPGPEPADRLV